MNRLLSMLRCVITVVILTRLGMNTEHLWSLSPSFGVDRDHSDSQPFDKQAAHALLEETKVDTSTPTEGLSSQNTLP